MLIDPAAIPRPNEVRVITSMNGSHTVSTIAAWPLNSLPTCSIAAPASADPS